MHEDELAEVDQAPEHVLHAGGAVAGGSDKLQRFRQLLGPRVTRDGAQVQLFNQLLVIVDFLEQLARQRSIQLPAPTPILSR